jgi:hypothetical protein
LALLNTRLPPLKKCCIETHLKAHKIIYGIILRYFLESECDTTQTKREDSKYVHMHTHTHTHTRTYITYIRTLSVLCC